MLVFVIIRPHRGITYLNSACCYILSSVVCTEMVHVLVLVLGTEVLVFVLVLEVKLLKMSCHVMLFRSNLHGHCCDFSSGNRWKISDYLLAVFV